MRGQRVLLQGYLIGFFWCFITIVSKAEELGLSAIALSGSDAPGSQGSFVTFLNPAINREGTVAFTAKTKDNDAPVLDIYEIFSRVVDSNLKGALISDSERISGKYWTLSQETLNRVGTFPIDSAGWIAGPVVIHGIFGSAIVHASPNLFVRKSTEDEVVLDLDPPQRFWSFVDTTSRPVAMNDRGEMVYQALYRFDLGLTRSGGGLRFSNPGKLSSSVEIFAGKEVSPDGAGLFGSFNEFVIRDLGEIAFIGNLFKETQGINVGITEANGGRIVVQTGPATFEAYAAEGTILTDVTVHERGEAVLGSQRSFESGFSGLTYNDRGQIAFGVQIYDQEKSGGSGTTVFVDNKFLNGLDVTRLYIGTDPDNLEAIITKGESAGIFSDAARFITGLSRPHLGNSGQVAFIADKGSSPDSFTGNGLFRFDSRDGSIQRIFQNGDGFGEDGLTFSRLGRSTDNGDRDFAINDRGQLAFLAYMLVPDDNLLRAGLFVEQADGTFKMVVREGLQIGDGQVAGLGDKNVKELHFQGGSTASGRSVGFSDNGSVAYRAVFEDDSSGIFSHAPPLPTVEFEWTGAFGGNFWHEDPTNWKDRNTGDPAESIPGDGVDEKAFIVGNEVVLFDREVNLESIDARGSLDVEAPLTLNGPSEIENLFLDSDLTTNGPLTLEGRDNLWVKGDINGGGLISLNGSDSGGAGAEMTIDATETTLRLDNPLRAVGGATLILDRGQLDLTNKGSLRIEAGIENLLELRSGTITDSGDDPSIVSSGSLVKTTEATVTLDAFLETTKEGSITVEAGILELSDPAILAGPIEISAGARLEATHLAALTLGDLSGTGLTLSGEGTFEKLGGPILLSGGGTVTVKLENPEGGFELGDEVTISGDDETLLLNGYLRKTEVGDSTIAVDVRLEPPGGSATVRSATMEVEGGKLALQRSLESRRGKLIVNAGEMAFDGISVGEVFSGHFTDETQFYASGGTIRFGSNSKSTHENSEFLVGPEGSVVVEFPSLPLCDVSLMSSNFEIQDSGTVTVDGLVRVSNDLMISGKGLFEINSRSSLSQAAEEDSEPFLTSIENELENSGMILRGGTIRGNWPPTIRERMFSDGSTIQILDEDSLTLVLSNSGIFTAESGEINRAVVRNIEVFGSPRTITLGGGDAPLALSQTLILNTIGGTINQKGAIIVKSFSEIRNGGTLGLADDLTAVEEGSLLMNNLRDGLISFSGVVNFIGGDKTFLNEGRVRLNPGSKVWLRSVDSRNLEKSSNSSYWILKNGSYEISDSSLSLSPFGEDSVVEIIEIGPDTYVKMVGVLSELNNLPTPKDVLRIKGFLDLEGIKFSFTGIQTILSVDSGGTLRLGPGSDLNVDRLWIKPKGTIISLTEKFIDTILRNEGNTVIGSSPGLLTVDGDYEQSETGILEIEIGGTEPGTEHDQLVVTGSATLGGTLQLMALEDFSPEQTTEVEVIKAGSIIGDFDQVVVLDESGRRSYDVTIGETGVMVAADIITASTFSEWEQALFTAEELVDPDIGGPNADSDRDGISNLGEYVHDGNPRRVNASPVEIRLTRNEQDKIDGLTATFPWANGMTDASYSLEVSPNLSDWETLPSEVLESQDQGLSSIIRLGATLSGELLERLFVRLHVSDSN